MFTLKKDNSFPRVKWSSQGFNIAPSYSRWVGRKCLGPVSEAFAAHSSKDKMKKIYLEISKREKKQSDLWTWSCWEDCVSTVFCLLWLLRQLHGLQNIDVCGSDPETSTQHKPNIQKEPWFLIDSLRPVSSWSLFPTCVNYTTLASMGFEAFLQPSTYSFWSILPSRYATHAFPSRLQRIKWKSLLECLCARWHRWMCSRSPVSHLEGPVLAAGENAKDLVAKYLLWARAATLVYLTATLPSRLPVGLLEFVTCFLARGSLVAIPGRVLGVLVPINAENLSCPKNRSQQSKCTSVENTLLS